MFNLKLLQTFKTSIDCGSFTSAAKLLNYSPSTVSKHISELERKVGAPLINEGILSKGLTPIGELTYNYAIEALVHFDEFNLKVHSALEATTRIRIGGMERYLSEMVVSKVIHYQQQHPHYQFDLLHRTGDETIDQLKDYSLDIGIVADRFVPPSFESLLVKRESLVLIASEETVKKVEQHDETLENLPILIDKKASVIFNYVLRDNNSYQNVIHVEGDDMLNKGAKENLCLGITSEGCFAPGEFQVLKVYNEKAPVRLIYPSKIHQDKLKEQFLQSLIRHIEQLDLI